MNDNVFDRMIGYKEVKREKLLGIPEFSRWLSAKGRLINGTV